MEFAFHHFCCIIQGCETFKVICNKNLCYNLCKGDCCMLIWIYFRAYILLKYAWQPKITDPQSQWATFSAPELAFYPIFRLIPLNLARCLVSFFGHQRSEQQLPADTTAMMSVLGEKHPLDSPTQPPPAPPTGRPFLWMASEEWRTAQNPLYRLKPNADSSL